MVDTLSPVVHGGRTRTYWISFALHTLAATAAAALLGAILGGLGAFAGAPWGEIGLVVILTAATIAALRDLAGLPLPLPELRRQVPEWWRTFFSRPVSATLYGFGLGFGFYTSITYATFVVVALVALTAGDPTLGALLCAPFGLGRALVVAAGDVDGVEPRQQRLCGRANGLATAALAVCSGALLTI